MTFIFNITIISSTSREDDIEELFVLWPYGNADAARVDVRLVVPLVSIHDNYKQTNKQILYSGVERCFGMGQLQGHVFCGFKSVHVRNHLIRLCPKIMGGGDQSPPSYATAYI